MRTIRTAVLLVACLVMLPFSVMLRSAGANSNVNAACDKYASVFETVAAQRVKGVPMQQMILRLQEAIKRGEVDPNLYSSYIEIIADVYAHTEMNPQQLRDKAEKLCLKAYGVVDA